MFATTTTVSHTDGTSINISTTKVTEVAAPGKVKFSYFPLKARGFPILLALEVGGVDYEAEIVQMADWGAMKASGVCPFGYLPLLTLADGTTVNETNACAMAAGHLGGINGDSPKDFSISAMLACKSAEVFTELTNVQPTMFTVQNWSAEKLPAYEEFKGKFEGYLAFFEKMVTDAKFTTTGTTVGELQLFSTLFHYDACGFKTIGDLPVGVKAFYERLLAHPAVAKCVANKTAFGELANYVVPVPK